MVPRETGLVPPPSIPAPSLQSATDAAKQGAKGQGEGRKKKRRVPVETKAAMDEAITTMKAFFSSIWKLGSSVERSFTVSFICSKLCSYHAVVLVVVVTLGAKCG